MLSRLAGSGSVRGSMTGRHGWEMLRCSGLANFHKKGTHGWPGTVDSITFSLLGLFLNSIASARYSSSSVLFAPVPKYRVCARMRRRREAILNKAS